MYSTLQRSEQWWAEQLQGTRICIISERRKKWNIPTRSKWKSDSASVKNDWVMGEKQQEFVVMWQRMTMIWTVKSLIMNGCYNGMWCKNVVMRKSKIWEFQWARARVWVGVVSGYVDHCRVLGLHFIKCVWYMGSYNNGTISIMLHKIVFSWRGQHGIIRQKCFHCRNECKAACGVWVGGKWLSAWVENKEAKKKVMQNWAQYLNVLLFIHIHNPHFSYRLWKFMSDGKLNKSLIYILQFKNAASWKWHIREDGIVLYFHILFLVASYSMPFYLHDRPKPIVGTFS